MCVGCRLTPRALVPTAQFPPVPERTDPTRHPSPRRLDPPCGPASLSGEASGSHDPLRTVIRRPVSASIGTRPGPTSHTIRSSAPAPKRRPSRPSRAWRGPSAARSGARLCSQGGLAAHLGGPVGLRAPPFGPPAGFQPLRSRLQHGPGSRTPAPGTPLSSRPPPQRLDRDSEPAGQVPMFVSELMTVSVRRWRSIVWLPAHGAHGWM